MRQAKEPIGVKAARDKVGFGVELFKVIRRDVRLFAIRPVDGVPWCGGFDVCSLERVGGSLDGIRKV